MATHNPNAIHYADAVRKHGDDWRINSYLEIPSHAQSGKTGFAILASGQTMSSDYLDFLIMLTRAKNRSIRQRNPWRFCPRCDREVPTRHAGAMCTRCELLF